MNRKFMEEATRLAIESVEKGWGGPFGAVIVKDGEIIGRGQNRVTYRMPGLPRRDHGDHRCVKPTHPTMLLGSDYHAGTVLEMIARPPGSPDFVSESARMLKGARST